MQVKQISIDILVPETANIEDLIKQIKAFIDNQKFNVLGIEKTEDLTALYKTMYDYDL